MAQTKSPLESRVLSAFKQALAEGQMAAADHLLCALEVLDRNGSLPGTSLPEAYFSILEPHSAA